MKKIKIDYSTDLTLIGNAKKLNLRHESDGFFSHPNYSQLFDLSASASDTKHIITNIENQLGKEFIKDVM